MNCVGAFPFYCLASAFLSSQDSGLDSGKLPQADIGTTTAESSPFCLCLAVKKVVFRWT